MIPTARIDPLVTSIEGHLDPKPYLGFDFESAVNEHRHSITTDIEYNIRQRCIKFTVKLTDELRSRLPHNLNIMKMTNMFSVGETLKVLKPSIVDIARNLGVDSSNMDLLVTQWKNITYTKWINTSNTIEFWVEVDKYRNASEENPYQELVSLAFSILSLPYSNADIEHVFSQVNIVKSKSRNRMMTQTLNAILLIRFGLRRTNYCCHSYKLPTSVLKTIGTSATYSSAASSNTAAVSSGTSQSSVGDQEEDEENVFFID
mgnify:CR=1 FL=1